MEIYLIRHTTPAVAKGICYGQSDLNVTATFTSEAAVIQRYLPDHVAAVYSSPLKRCKILAEYLFNEHTIQLHHELKEINCGKWEMQLWDDIPKQEIEPWMNDLINVPIPGGESYQELFERVRDWFVQIISKHGNSARESNSDADPEAIVIVAHGGILRSILSHITQTPLADSFKAFSLHYGCVIKIVSVNDELKHEVLSNIRQEKETHKPSQI